MEAHLKLSCQISGALFRLQRLIITIIIKLEELLLQTLVMFFLVVVVGTVDKMKDVFSRMCIRGGARVVHLLCAHA